MKFSDQQWSPTEYSDQLRLTRLEGNLWICIYNFIASPVCRSKYRMDDVRKTHILKVSPNHNVVEGNLTLF
jgi:zinc finger MYND domain-containing protein 10